MKKLNFKWILLGVLLISQTVFSAEDPKVSKKSPVGTWYSKVNEFNTTDHFLIKRTADGKFKTRMMYVNHKAKNYTYESAHGTWKYDSRILQETDSEGQVIKYTVKTLTDKKLVYVVKFDNGRENVITESRTNQKQLTAPPKGYKKVSPQVYGDLL